GAQDGAFGRPQRDISRYHDDRNAPLRMGFANRDFERPWHVVCARDELTVVAALAEQRLRMGLLEVARADFPGRNVSGDGQHRHTRALAIEEPVDQVQVARSAAAGADGEAPREMGLRARGESSHLLVPDVNPFDLALPAQAVCNPVEAVAHDAIHTLHSCQRERLRKLIGDRGHRTTPAKGKVQARVSFDPWTDTRESPWSMRTPRLARVRGRKSMAAQDHARATGCKPRTAPRRARARGAAS